MKLNEWSNKLGFNQPCQHNNSHDNHNMNHTQVHLQLYRAYIQTSLVGSFFESIPAGTSDTASALFILLAHTTQSS